MERGERAVTMGRIADILQARGQLDEALRIRRGEELPVRALRRPVFLSSSIPFRQERAALRCAETVTRVAERRGRATVPPSSTRRVFEALLPRLQPEVEGGS